MNNSYNMSCLIGVLNSFYFFNTNKCVHIEFTELATSYHVKEQAIPKLNSHCKLGVIMCDDLSWRNHHIYIPIYLQNLTSYSSHIQVITLSSYIELKVDM